MIGLPFSCCQVCLSWKISYFPLVKGFETRKMIFYFLCNCTYHRLFIILNLTISNPKGLSSDHLKLSFSHWNMGFNKILGKIILHLALSFIQHFNPVRITLRITIALILLVRFSLLFIQVRMSYVYTQNDRNFNT